VTTAEQHDGKIPGTYHLKQVDNAKWDKAIRAYRFPDGSVGRFEHGVFVALPTPEPVEQGAMLS
jgi:hypothetical protein